MGFLMEGLDRKLLQTSATSCATSAARAKAVPTPRRRGSRAPALSEGASVLRRRHRQRTRTSKPRASRTSATSTSSSIRRTTRPSRLRATSIREVEGPADQVLWADSRRAEGRAGHGGDAADHGAEARHGDRYGALPQMTIAWLTPARFTAGIERCGCCNVRAGRSEGQPPGPGAGVQDPGGAERVLRNVSKKLNGSAQCTVTAKPGVKLEDLEKTVWSEIAKLQQEGPTAQEVEAAKARPDAEDHRPAAAGRLWRHRRYAQRVQPVHRRPRLICPRTLRRRRL